MIYDGKDPIPLFSLFLFFSLSLSFLLFPSSSRHQQIVPWRNLHSLLNTHSKNGHKRPNKVELNVVKIAFDCKRLWDSLIRQALTRNILAKNRLIINFVLCRHENKRYQLYASMKNLFYGIVDYIECGIYWIFQRFFFRFVFFSLPQINCVFQIFNSFSWDVLKTPENVHIGFERLLWARLANEFILWHQMQRRDKTITNNY